MVELSVLLGVRSTVVVIGTAALVLAAAHHAMDRNIAHLWGASNLFWQEQWNHLYHDIAGGNEFMLYCGMYIVSILFFWLFNVFFIFLELTGNPVRILQYRIQPKQKPAIVKWSDFAKCVKLVVFNQTVVGIPFHILAWPAYQWRGGLLEATVPEFKQCMLEMVVFALVIELFFFYTHRSFHNPYLYKHIHKIHHEWTTPISISAVYCHPVEYIFGNIVPVVAGPFICGSHLITTMVWLFISLASTSISHCGFHLPFMPSNESHDYHHSQFTQNFGIMGILDLLHGTNDRFRKTKSYERHNVLLSTTPANVLIPDEKPTATCG